jgi:hypothetical protein
VQHSQYEQAVRAGHRALQEVTTGQSRDDLILKLGRDRILAHQVLFKHRHVNETPPAHYDLIRLWHSQKAKILVMAFREFGKSTIAEEAFVLGACYQLFHNAIIIGSTEKRACERLRAIKHEIETNELLQQLFGYQVGRVWNEAEVILANGVRIIAVGRGQSLRGTKHLHWRPDFAFCDDIEDKEHVTTPEARDATQAWFMDELLPCLDRNARIRMNATPLDRDSLPMRIKKWDAWETIVYPIEYVDERGERQATWSDRYPLVWVDAKRREYADAGDMEGYAREYMCVAEDPKAKIFTSSMFKVEPRVRTWQPVFAMYDPARTTKQTSATTGWAVWSWIANRMVVWDAGAELWKPDELIDHIFKTNDQYSPVEIGVEEDGLNEFLLQPLRHAQLARNTLVPLRAMRAPRGKIAFIEGLQPYFMAGEISFAKELNALVQQFLSFPTGHIDAPNALAYSVRMRPGIVVYEDFGSGHVYDELPVRVRAPLWLCLNAGHGLVTGVVVQVVDGGLHVLADYVREGDPGGVLEGLVVDARVEYGDCRFVAGPDHYGVYSRLGLRGAVAKLPAELRKGGDEAVGRDEIRVLLRRQIRGLPALRISAKAHWTLNAFAAGYARSVDKRGVVQDEARDDVYRVLMEGLETFTAHMNLGSLSDSPPNIRFTEGGQRYVSALPSRTAPLPAKDDLLRDFGVVSDLGMPRSARR